MTGPEGPELHELAEAFQVELATVKAEIGPDFPWYPYDILASWRALRPVLADHPIEALVKRRRIADIGAADGDAAFFFERLGYDVDVIDHAQTNFNSMRGVRKLAKHLRSRVVIRDLDLDGQFQLPAGRYDLVLFLGILYHLRNPMFALGTLARSSRYLLLSTRVARLTPDGRSIQDLPAAYLVSPTELNNDSTNYWIFTDTGLARVLDRSGWDIIKVVNLGDTEHSDPTRGDRDERAFLLAESRDYVPPSMPRRIVESSTTAGKNAVRRVVTRLRAT